MKPRIYIDTSVIGGCFDEEFAEESNRLIQMAQEGEIVLLLSDLLLQEVSRAPEEVRRRLASLPAESTEMLISTTEDVELRKAYLAAGVVSPGAENDAHHVAIATIAKADVIVSWNFKHLVHWDKIRLFNAVNLRAGFAMIEIRTPQEVV
ncbi:MAG TPA: PIN domain-containing protein [Thermoguttaceae bacterium]